MRDHMHLERKGLHSFMTQVKEQAQRLIEKHSGEFLPHGFGIWPDGLVTKLLDFSNTDRKIKSLTDFASVLALSQAGGAIIAAVEEQRLVLAGFCASHCSIEILPFTAGANGVVWKEEANQELEDSERKLTLGPGLTLIREAFRVDEDTPFVPQTDMVQ